MLDILQEASLIRRVTRKVYWNSRFARLRTQLDEEDLVQMVFLKLLHRDNYLKYSEDYPLVGFIYRVANGCAISYANKASIAREYVILDQPRDDSEDSRTIMDMLVSENPHIDLDTQVRINRIAANMSPKENHNFIIRYKDNVKPFSIENLFDLFIETKYTREELRKCVINKKSNTIATQTTFDKFWKMMEKSAMVELNKCLD